MKYVCIFIAINIFIIIMMMKSLKMSRKLLYYMKEVINYIILNKYFYDYGKKYNNVIIHIKIK